jgi:hypothetical protein
MGSMGLSMDFFSFFLLTEAGISTALGKIHLP